MPFLKIQSNEVFLHAEDILSQASKIIAEILGKPETYVLVSLEVNRQMLFGGTGEPLIYCELKSIGLQKSQTKEISKLLTEFLTAKTGVDASRIYIEFAAVDRNMWGWNGDTFG